MRVLEDALLGLLFTIVLELPVAAVFGFRRAHELGAVALASAVTYPMLSVAIAFVPGQVAGRADGLFIVALEIGVVIAEWRLLTYALRQQQRALITSAVMNLVSFLGGLMFLR